MSQSEFKTTLSYDGLLDPVLTAECARRRIKRQQLLRDLVYSFAISCRTGQPFKYVTAPIMIRGAVNTDHRWRAGQILKVDSQGMVPDDVAVKGGIDDASSF